MIEIINAKLGLNKVFFKADITLDELKRKAPHKKKLIKSQEESVNEIATAQVVLHRLDTKVMALQSDLHSKNLTIQIQLLEIKNLKKEIDILKKINNKLLADAKM
jgi:hypothetical protein